MARSPASDTRQTDKSDNATVPAESARGLTPSPPKTWCHAPRKSRALRCSTCRGRPAKVRRTCSIPRPASRLASRPRKASRQAFGDVVANYAFTVIPIGLAMTGAMLAGGGPGLIIAAASGLVGLTRFWKFDRKLVIANGDMDAAAMLHDAREVLSLD